MFTQTHARAREQGRTEGECVHICVYIGVYIGVHIYTHTHTHALEQDEAEGPQDASSWRALTSNDSPSQSIALLSPSEQHTWGMKGLLQSMDSTKQLLQMGKSVHKKEKEGFRKSFFKNFQKSS